MQCFPARCSLNGTYNASGQCHRCRRMLRSHDEPPAAMAAAPCPDLGLSPRFLVTFAGSLPSYPLCLPASLSCLVDVSLFTFGVAWCMCVTSIAVPRQPLLLPLLLQASIEPKRIRHPLLPLHRGSQQQENHYSSHRCTRRRRAAALITPGLRHRRRILSSSVRSATSIGRAPRYRLSLRMR